MKRCFVFFKKTAVGINKEKCIHIEIKSKKLCKLNKMIFVFIWWMRNFIWRWEVSDRINNSGGLHSIIGRKQIMTKKYLLTSP